MRAKRAIVFATAVSGLAGICFGQLPAPVAGPSVNMVSGTQLPGGDPFLQRQNEPSMAVSSRNALHLMGGANDYRTVDLPGLPGGEPTGDAWLGLFKSFDGGKNWASTLLPGFPQDTSPEGRASPLHGFQAAADPFVRAGTNGLFYYSGIVFNRSLTGANGASSVFVASFIDDNNRDGSDTIRYLRTSIVKAAAVPSGSTELDFEDKPSIAVDLPRLGAKTCAMPGSPAQSFAGGNIYIAWTEFNGPKANNDARIQFSKSDDCGQTWSVARNISGTQHTNQGAALAIDPFTGAVFVVWRVFAHAPDVDAIMLTASYDGGRTWTQAAPVAAISPFDQGTTNLSFRTNAYPAIAVDYLRRLYVTWAQRGPTANPDARIVITSIVPPLTDDARAWRAVQWPPARPVDPYSGRGHQLMPAMAFSSGKLSLAWYDLRLDDQIAVYTPSGPGQYSKLVMPDGMVVWGPFVQDPAPPYQANSRRHTLDVRLAQAPPGFPPAFGASIQVSQYEFGFLIGATNPIQQLEVNPPNLPIFQQGTVPFLGDYIDIAGPTFLPLPGILSFIWRPNLLPADPDHTRVVWTDNRNVVQPQDGDWTHYTPVGTTAAGTSVFDPTQQRPGCIQGQGGSRNQDIFTGSVSPVLVTAQSNDKPLSKTLQREFPITVENTTGTARFYRLTIQQQPVGGKASFLQFPVTGFPDPMTSIDVQIGANGSSSRSAFVTSSDPNATVTINVVEIQAPNGTTVPNGLQSSVLLNADASNPNISNPNISNTEIYTPNISNPNISNPNISNPNISNPNISNPNISNPNISNATVANPNISNPNISNPNISNPNISNPNISNPNISNATVAASALTDTTWPITNTGNTAASYSLKLLQGQTPPAGVFVQLIVSKTYTTTVVSGCNLGVETHFLPVANITSPAFVTDPRALTQTTNDPFAPSVSLAPGETALITIRSVDQTTHDPASALQHFNAAQTISPVAIPPATATPNAAPVPPLIMATLPLPAATVSGAYSQTLTAAGGAPPYSWSITAGNADGLTIVAATGVLQGVPAAAFPLGTPFTVTLSDSAGNSTARGFTLVVNPAPAITTAVLANADQGFLYASQSLQATGGTLPLTWSIVSPGSLPVGLLLSTAGVISGTPAANALSATFTVQATDANHVAATRPLTINVFAPPAIVTATLPAGQQGAAYNQAIIATAGLPVTWSITTGSIPAGLTFFNGALTGTTTTAGTYTFTVQVQDTLGAVASRPFSILVNTPVGGPSLAGGALPDATENTAYSQSIPVTNGTAPFSFQVIGGALPSGLTLSPSGTAATISGIPTAGCGFSFTIQVTDSLGATGAALFSLNVILPPGTPGFTGAYVLQNWTASASNGGTTAINPASGPSGCPAFSYSIDLRNPPGTGTGGGVPARTWTFQTTAPSSGTVTFNWHYSGFHAYFQVTALLQVLAGANTITLYSAGPVNCCSTPSAGFDISGTATIQVTGGSPFGFIVGGSNADSNSQLNGTLTISNFTAPGQ